MVTRKAIPTASMISFLFGVSSRKKYPSTRLASMERKPRRVEVMSQSSEIRVNPMSALIAPSHDDRSLGTKKSFFSPQRSMICRVKTSPSQTMAVVRRFRIV